MAPADGEIGRPLDLLLLGWPQIRLGGELLRGQPPVKGQALLFYLAVTRKTMTREALAGLFWGEMEEEAARANLRLTLSRLHKLVGPCLVADRREIRCDFDWPVRVDVHQFDAVAAMRQSTAPALAAALNLYRGEFLHDFPVGDAPDFEIWVLRERERLHRLALSGLQTVGKAQFEAGNYLGAINGVRRMLDLEPWHEEAHRRLMWLLSVSGQRSAALTQYEACCRILDQELGVTPEEETTALYEKIKQGNLQASKTQVGKAAEQWPLAGEASQSADEPAAADVDELTRGLPEHRFVGCERELQTLRSTLHQAITGGFRQLFIVGGAGRGKSSLVREFVRCSPDDTPELLIASGRCSAHEGIGDPYLPFREILYQLGRRCTHNQRRGAGAQASQQPGARSRRHYPAAGRRSARSDREFCPCPATARQGAALGCGGCAVAEAAVTVGRRPSTLPAGTAALVCPSHIVFDEPGRQTPAGAGAGGSALGRRFVRSSPVSSQPCSDGKSNSAGWDLSPRGSCDGAKPGVTSTGGCTGELKRQQGHIWIDLGQQSPAEGRAFVDAYLDTEPNLLDESFRGRLFRHTGGHALFTVEVLRELQMRGELARDEAGNWIAARAIDWNTLPARVEGVIEQRIGAVDRDLRAYLTIAAVEGESFTAEVIARLVGVEARVAVRRLSQELGQEYRLVQAQSLEYAGEQRLSRFRFRHQLFQQYLYQVLNAAERAYYHEDVGNALESLYGQHWPAIAGALAEHFQAAGSTKAVRYLALAAQQAHVKTANIEAAQYARAGLSLLETIPSGADRMKLELLLQIVRGRSAMYTEGYAAEEAEAGFVRAMQLCEQMGRIPQIFPVMYGLWALYMMRGELVTARQQAAKHIALAAEQDNVRAEMLGHGMLGLPLCWLGSLEESGQHLEHLFAWYQPEYDTENIAVLGQAALLARLASLPMLLAMLGYTDQALTTQRRILAMSKALSDPISHAFVLSFSGITYQLIHDVENTAFYAEATIAHCEKYSIPLSLAYGHVLRGWVLCMRGDPQGALLMRAHIEHLLARRELSGTTWLISLLAEGLARSGQRQAALGAVEEGLALTNSIDDVSNKVFLLHLRGDILMELAPGGSAADATLRQEAEEHLLAAIQLGQRTGNRLGALRATISLCKVWNAQGKGADAQRILRTVYTLHSEGYDTTLMREASDLLAAYG